MPHPAGLGQTRRRPASPSPKVSARTDPVFCSQRHRKRTARDDQGCEKTYFQQVRRADGGHEPEEKTGEGRLGHGIGPQCESCLYPGPVRRAIHSETTQQSAIETNTTSPFSCLLSSRPSQPDATSGRTQDAPLLPALHAGCTLRNGWADAWSTQRSTEGRVKYTSRVRHQLWNCHTFETSRTGTLP